MNLSILYRGPLLSCNYGCEYCPFAKRQQTAAELSVDQHALARFVQWIADHPEHTFSLLFTPWGEALIHPWYQTGLSQLSHLPNVKKVAIQTNLSCNLDWITGANPTTLALWATFHPEWSNADRFLEKCHTLIRHNISFSVGMVGFAKFKQAMTMMRDRLPPHIYLWINAVKKELPNLSPEDRAFFQSIDPHYELNTHHYPSFGKACQAGETVFSVDGEGTLRRCHFIKAPIGNIYDPDFEQVLCRRPCTNETCHCYIGYVHMDELAMPKIYGDRVLERIPLNHQRASHQHASHQRVK